jgi:RHS repeat-associated protein
VRARLNLVGRPKGRVRGRSARKEKRTLSHPSSGRGLASGWVYNGLYTLRLEATDANQQTSRAEITVQVQGGMKVGVFTLSFVDLQIPVSGIPITVTRTYDSRIKSTEDFGVGWTLDVAAGRYSHNRAPGEGWELEDPPGVFTLPCSQVNELLTHRTEVRLSDREWYSFAPTVLGAAPTVGGCTAQMGFTQIGGYALGATLEILGNTYVFQGAGDDVLYDDETLLPWAPQQVLLTTYDGRVVELERGRGITALEDLLGNRLEIGPSGILASNGQSITFTRDAEGRITQITDPMNRRLVYAYDASGDLVEFTNQAGQDTTFFYDDRHNLIDIIDVLGVRAVRNDYDEAGRWIASTDALGHRREMTHNLTTRVEVVEDPLGDATTYEYDLRGNVTAEENALGQRTTYTYNAGDDQLTVTNPLGQTMSFAYDGSHRLTSFSDPLGNTQLRAYNARGQEVSFTDARGTTSATNFDAAGRYLGVNGPLGINTIITRTTNGRQVAAMTDPEDHVTSYSYDGQGRLTSQTNPLGRVLSYTLDANHNRTSQTVSRTLPGGGTEVLTTQWGYDALGRATTIQTADGGQMTLAYYGASRELASTIDALGAVTTYQRDPLGRVVSVVLPDGTSDLTEYNANGDRVAYTDRLGHRTQFVYDAARRLISTVHPDWSSESQVYDAAGRVTSRTDANGHTSTFTYDAAGRMLTQVDALGHVNTFTYDENSNVLTETDAAGHTTTHLYDAAGRRTRTTFHDGTFTEREYDGLGRVTLARDPEGNETLYAYDGVGNLTQVTDPMGAVTTYAYDEVNNLVTQTDALGRQTRWQYDPVGRVTRRTLPLGQYETMAYNARGDQTGHTTFNGEAIGFAYDLSGRLLAKTLPGGTVVQYGYNPNGQRSFVVDDRGATSFSYDLRGRLSAVAEPDGRTVSYTYDASGNRTSMTAPFGTIGYSYDAAHRLSSVTDHRGGVSTYVYENVGNRVETHYPNGVVGLFSFDALNRVTEIEYETAGGTVLERFTYTLSASGQRESVVQLDGRRVDYLYDANERLTDEIVTPAGGSASPTAFTYDAVGNRTSLGTLSGTRVYDYDANDRLLDDDVATFTYDAAGRLTSRTDGVGTTTYGWSPEDRLLSVATPGHGIGYSYDADGLRVATTLDGVVTDHLLDRAKPYAQLIEERTGASATVHVFGHELLSTGGAVPLYVHQDHLASTRLTTTTAGAVQGRYNYEAFGAPSSATAPVVRHMFAGEPWEADADLQYLRARHYAPGTGRFASMDPFAGLQERPDTRHRYAYAGGNPVGLVDPSGMSMMSVGVSIAIGATIIGAAYLGVTTWSNTEAKVKGNSIYLDWSEISTPTVGEGVSLIGVVGAFSSKFSDFNVSIHVDPPPGIIRHVQFLAEPFLLFEVYSSVVGNHLGATFGRESYVFVNPLLRRSNYDHGQTHLIANTAAHEVGHGFGLPHVQQISIMFGGSPFADASLDWSAEHHQYLLNFLGPVRP